jgi:hypothetical protein
VPSYDTYTTSNLYLFPFVLPKRMNLYIVLFGARLASAGSATARLALYRSARPRGLLARQDPITGASPHDMEPLGVFDVSYGTLDLTATPQYVATSSITNTTGWLRLTGRFDRNRELSPDVQYFIGFVSRQQSILLSAPTDPSDLPSYECTGQNPAAGDFPSSPTINRLVRTPAMRLLSPTGAASFGL